MRTYLEDLAYINDIGFSDFTIGATAGVLGILRREGVRSGLVVDCGCGSGYLAGTLAAAGYRVLGVDLSPEMIRLAKRRAPHARFLTGSFLQTELPVCDAVTAIGEVVNYRFDPQHSRIALSGLFKRVHRALRPGGVFLFDVAGPDRVPPIVPANYWKEGDGWAIHVEVDGNAAKRQMTRRIVCFRKGAAGSYRRSEEIHPLRLFDPAAVAAELDSMGFRVRVQPNYGRFRLYAGMHAIVARKK